LFSGTESYEFKNESFENRPHIISVAVSVWVWFLYHSFMLGARDPFKNIYQLPLYAKQKLRPLPLENDSVHKNNLRGELCSVAQALVQVDM